MRRENKQQGGVLPPGYTQLQYIESNGTQYIDTGYYPNGNTYFFLDFQQMKYDVRSNDIAGVRWTASPDYMTFAFSDASNSNYRIYYYCGTGSGSSHAGPITPNDSNFLLYRHSGYIDALNGRADIDGYYAVFTPTSFSSSPYSLPLCGFNNMGNKTKGYDRIYQSYIKELDTYIRNYIPVLRIADSKPGLYDLSGSICPLTNTPFYVNAGTGEFLYA